MNSVNKIDYIESPTKNIQKTKLFFEQVFGWKFQDYGPEYTAYHDGRIAGVFYASQTVTTSERGGVLVVFYSDKLELTRSQVTQAGGHLIRDIFSFPGGRRFHFLEPGGGEYVVWSDR